MLFYEIILTTSAVSSTNLGSTLIVHLLIRPQAVSAIPITVQRSPKVQERESARFNASPRAAGVLRNKIQGTIRAGA